MAKKQDKNKKNPQDYDPRFDDPAEFGIQDDPYGAYTPQGAAPASSGGKSGGKSSKTEKKKYPKEGMGCLGFIGAILKTLILAVFLLILFAVLGFAVVAGGQAAGLFAPSEFSVDVASLPTPTPSLLDLAQIEGAATSAAMMQECDNPQAWWDAIVDEYAAFVPAYARIAYAPGDVINDVRADLEVKRTSILEAAFDPCLTVSRAALSTGMDAMIASVTALADLDRPGATGQANNAAAAFAEAQANLWNFGVVTDEQSAPALEVPFGGGDECAPGEWYAAITAAWTPFNTIVGSLDLVNSDPNDVARDIEQVRALYTALEAVTPPECAEIPHAAALAALSSYADAIVRTQGLEGETVDRDAARPFAETFARNLVTLKVWLSWLNLPVV